MVGLFGSVDFPDEPEFFAVVNFSEPLSTDDFVVLLTPVARDCLPKVVAKSKTGFVFQCAISGTGGSVDWAVLLSLGQKTGPGLAPGPPAPRGP